MIEKVLDIIFPKVCLNCGKQGENYICSSCFLKMGLKFKILNIKNHPYEKLIYLDIYKDDIRKKLLKFKFYDGAYLNEYFLEFLLNDNKICKSLKRFDIVIPVPMFKGKKLKRGYNQTELLGKNLAKNLKLNYYDDVLVKYNENKTQSLLDEEQRKENVKNVFKIKNENKIYDKNIILIDDIFTTGSTVSECSRILKNAGAKNIYVLVIAKSR